MTSDASRPGVTTCVFSTTLVVLLFSLSLFAQANFGRILGTVADPTGAVLPGASISIIDKDRGLARTVTTDEAGQYNAPTLIPGTYTVRVEFPGFKTLDRQNVVVEVGKEIRVDLTIEPGQQSETVTVNEAIPLVDATGATLGGTLSNADINDMPLNGRNYQNLLNLRPGVMIQPGGSPWTQSTNNIRPDETAWMVDGVINANFSDARPVANMPSPFTDAAVILPIDAIQEFNLEENPKAEYGWKPGAVVNVGIRSGTNAFHGSAYAFGRNGSWDARNFFNPAPQPVAPVELKQFGGVMGGPVKKDKLFFFAGYEGLRSIVGNAFANNVPEIAGQPKPDPKNSMVDAINALQTAGVTPSPISLKLLGCTAGSAVACTGGLIQGASPNTTSYTSSFPNNNVSDNGIAKVDYRINSKHMINGMLLTGAYTGNGEDHAEVNPNFEILVPIRTWTIVGNWIWTASSRVVNEARFGWNLVNFFQYPDDNNVLADGKGYPLNTGVTTSGGLPEIRITPFAYIGAATNRPNGFSNPYYDYQDSLSYLRGKHTFKFGGGFTRIEVNNFNGNTSRGRIDFQGKQTPQIPNSTPLEDFFAGNPSRGFLLIGNGVRTQHGTASSGFIQDDWRIAPKFMLNLGLRYAYASPFKEVNNLLGNFDPKLGMVQQGQPSVGDTLLHPNRKNFSPRVGFAWDFTGKGTTVIRAGASVIYSTLTSGIAGGLSLQDSGSTGLSSVPTGGCKTTVVVGVPCPETFGGTLQLASANIPGSKLNWSGVVFPSGAGISCTAAVPCSIMAVDPNLKTPYIVNWNFGVQHAFNPNLSLEVGYVGNHGDNLLGFRDINQIDITTGARPYADKFPYLKFINRISNQARSNYDSLQTTLTKRASHGLSFTAGYTYGHGLDNGSLNRFGYLPQDSRNPGAEYASGDFDVRHRFTLTTTYNIPAIKGFGQLLEGWKLNSIVNLQASQPWEVNDYTNDFSGSGDQADRWNFYGNPSDFKSGSSSIPYCSGFGDPLGVHCSTTSGVSGIVTVLPASLAQQCLAVAPDPSTLHDGGCYVSGKSVMVPPKRGTYGTMGRNIFRDSGFKNWDFSVFKNFTFKERFNAQFRVEFFNLLNHPLISNPYGASTNYGGSGTQNDMGTPSIFGCGCATPDVSAGNPLIGSGASRDIQLGLKLTF
jgi:Carboxypeptidase regulatory-like domain/TonB dependent receptor